MILRIKHQEEYSRGELLLRSFFGFFYIYIPHFFLLFFIQIASGFINLISFWIILFTGEFPESFYTFQIKVMRWSTRLSATQYNLVDGYPAFGLNGESDKVELKFAYPKQMNRGSVLLRALFGYFYCILPHGFILIFRSIASSVISFLAFWVVLFTGKFNKSWHEFQVGTIRWNLRVSAYMGYLTDDYPPFSGQELPEEVEEIENAEKVI